MSSLVQGYEYDIFISYRHKDNKYDHWVTDFVSNLKRELEATFRDELSVYFDNNPKDGLLITHDVDESLKGKLRCLVFIPLISHTYCDQASFAWAHEFRSFIEQASTDKYGLKVKLPNGNYASRVLPLIIHDLQDDEKILCERILGSQLRGIEFIYSEPGVNRPLSPNEENPHDNLNRTTYRNQINKVANAIKEIITAIIEIDKSKIPSDIGFSGIEPVRVHKRLPDKWRILAAAFILISLIITGYLYFSGKSVSEDITIAVLPFKDLSVGEDQKKFTAGVMREIMIGLFQIDGFRIPASTATEQYEHSAVPLKDIARELKVSYLLEGDVTRDSDKVRIGVRLINGKTGQLHWSRDYDTTYSAMNMIGINRNVARQIAATLDVAFRSLVINRMSFQIKNNEAYDLYLKATPVSAEVPEEEYQESIDMFEKVTRMEPSFAPAYAELAFFRIYEGAMGGWVLREEVLNNAEPLVSKALELDKNLFKAHLAKALIRLYYYQDFRSVNREFKKVKRLSPASTEEIAMFSDYLHAMGRHKEAFDAVMNAFSHNKKTVQGWINMALAYFYTGQKELAMKTLDTAWKHFPENDLLFISSIRIMIYSGDYRGAMDLFKGKFNSEDPNDMNLSFDLCLIASASYKTGDTLSAEKYLNEILIKSEKSPVDSPSFFAAALYAAMNEKDNAFRMLEKSSANKEVELYWLKVDPLFYSLHDDPRFKRLLKKIGF